MSKNIWTDHESQVVKRERSLLLLAFSVLVLFAVGLTIAPAVRADSLSALRLPGTHWLALPAWAASAWLLHRFAHGFHPNRDPLILPLGMLLTGWGTLTIWRLSGPFGARQSAWLLVATGLAVIVLRGPSDLAWLRKYRYLWLIGGFLLTALTLFLGTNPSGGDPKLWLGCCGVYIQPSEPLRLLLIAYMASYLADRVNLLRFGGKGLRFPSLGPLLLAWGLSVTLLLVQRDLGTGMLLLALLAGLLFLTSGRWRVLLAASGLGILAGGLGYLVFDVVQARFQAWLFPWTDPTATGYQIIQSLIAIASGGLTGTGPGLGSPTLVPVVHTDFIFAAVAEEWGLVGGIGLITCFALFVGRGLRSAASHKDAFPAILVAGVSLSIGLQGILIIGGVIRVFPITGVTLPFISYGGSSLVTTFIGMAFLIVLSKDRVERGVFHASHRRMFLILAGLWAGLALVLGWWILYRAPTLTSRTDNPRRAISERYVKRGRILDRNGVVLAYSEGDRGSYNRTYPDPTFSNVVGYNSPRYGQAGIEDSLDDVLRGADFPGTINQAWKELLDSTEEAGLDVQMTLDRRYQNLAADILKDERGAIVILNPTNGDLLALSSSPSFDSNHIEDDWVELIQREDAPLLDRATHSRYQPGMAIAPFLYAWSLAQGEVAPESKFTEVWQFQSINQIDFQCRVHSLRNTMLTIPQALVGGCRGPFSQLADQLGPVSLKEMFRAFAFLEPLDLRLDTIAPTDLEGMPTGVGLWLEGVGQGNLTITPAHLGRAFATLQVGGSVPALRLVRAVEERGGAMHSVEALGLRGEGITREHAQQAWSALPLLGEFTRGYSGEAIVGGEGKRLAWFLGGISDPVRPRTLILILEGSSRDEVQEMGTRILTAIRALDEPGS